MVIVLAFDTLVQRLLYALRKFVAKLAVGGHQEDSCSAYPGLYRDYKRLKLG